MNFFNALTSLFPREMNREHFVKISLTALSVIPSKAIQCSGIRVSARKNLEVKQKME